MRELVANLLVVPLGCLVLVVFFLVLRKVTIGAVLIATIAYDLASDYGIAGKALYFFCWNPLFPIMLPICVCVGMLIMFGRGNFSEPIWGSPPEPAGNSRRKSRGFTAD